MGAVLLTVPRPASIVIAAASGPLLVNSTGSSVYAVVHLTLLAARLQASHSQAGRLGEHRERARITQDLHDLVGSSLVSIAMQSEQALARTTSAAPGHQALTDIAALARRTHQEIRSITGHRIAADLHTEAAHAQNLLSRAGIATRTSLPARLDLGGPTANCMSAVLREGIGNVLQHCQASRCEIEVTAQDSQSPMSPSP